MTDVLIFIEDPGAANGLADLPGALGERGISATVLAAGHAVDYLAFFETPFTAVDAAEGPAFLLDRHAPRAIVTGTSENPDTAALPLIAEAHRRGLATVAFVDGPASAEYRFRGKGREPLAFAPDWILAADSVTASRFRGLGHPGDHVIECGHPYFDRVRKVGDALTREGPDVVRARVLPDAPADRPVVAFLTEISDGLAPADHVRSAAYTLAGRGDNDQRCHIVLEELLDALAPLTPRPYLVLRLHPKNTSQEFALYAREVDHISEGGSAAEVVFAADLVVGMTSILLFEAALMECPVLSVVPRPEETQWLTAIGLGIVPAVHTRDALRATLTNAIAKPDRIMGTPASEVIHFGALERVCDFVADLLAASDEGLIVLEQNDPGRE